MDLGDTAGNPAITSTAIKIHSNGDITPPTPFGLIAGRIPEDLLEQTWRIGPEPVRSRSFRCVS